MSDKQKKSDKPNVLRVPKSKNKLGLKIVPHVREPHEDYIKPMESLTSQSSQAPPSQPSQSSQSKQSSQNSQEIAPSKNFQKVPNSITSQAIPQGLFRPGKSKHLYDVLYSLTRGAIIPSRKVRISKAELMKKAGIGSRITFDTSIAHLQQVGLLKVNIFSGQHSGNEFEVLTPDEITQTSQTSLTSLTSPAQFLDRLVCLETSQTSQSSNPINIVLEGDPKTLYKTEEKKIDDEPQAAFRAFLEKINQGFRELTGREATLSDEMKLAQLGELIAAELMEAASRTKVVSDPAAFLLTHMRRRLGVRAVTVESTSEKKTSKSTKQEICLTDDEIQECPDCEGRLVVYPQGREKGAIVCRHPKLVKAKQESISHKPEREEKEQ